MKTLLPDQPSAALVGSHEGETAGDARYCCVLCHRDAWISPGGQERLRRFPPTKVVCLLCYLEGSLDNEPPSCREAAAGKIRNRYSDDK